MERFWNIFGGIFMIFFIGLCTWSIVESDRNARMVYADTHEFVVTNKDRDSDGCRIWIDRYGIDGGKIDIRHHNLGFIDVTDYEYGLLGVSQV